ncbi:MAG: DMT family transporter [Planctomycetaceae bacterium]|nr:DMT family transporter [Planctomycetaceae bacterium]
MKILPDLSLFGVAFIWGINIPVMKNGLDQLDRFSFNAIRLAVSALVLVLIAWVERRGGVRPSDQLSRRHVIVYALIVSVLYQLMFLLGISDSNSANTALIIATVPMWTAIAARIFLKEFLRPIQWAGLVIALGGTFVVALQKSSISIGSDTLWGNLFALGAALSWSAGTVYSRPLLKMISPTRLSATSAVIGLPVHFAVALIPWADRSDFGEDLRQSMQLPMALIILYSGVFSTGLALPMWNYGVRHSGAARAAIIQNLIPVVAIVGAWAWRGEAVSVQQLIGAFLIISGLILIRFRSRTGSQTVKSSERLHKVAAPEESNARTHVR